MKKLSYDLFQKTPVIGRDEYLFEWAKKVPIQIRKINGRWRILINKLKIIKTMTIDSLEIVMYHYCLKCLQDYGEKVKMVGLYNRTTTYPFEKKYYGWQCPYCFYEEK